MKDTWYKLDNVAKVFVATNTRRDPRVFRVCCTLTEKVDAELLDKALQKTAQQFPNFQVTLHRGLFWHYLESTTQKPHPVPETQAPCSEIYADGENRLLYRVSWFDRRINLEVFHVLADGNGGMMFLKCLVCDYLKAAHPNELLDVVPEYDASDDELAQDSFRKFYGGKPASGGYTSRAFHLHGARLPYDQTQYFEAHCNAPAALAQAKAAGVTLTSWMGAALMLSIWKEMPAMEHSRPVVISLPVNLRNYYPSATSRNFFNTVKVGHVFSGEETLQTLAQEFDERLKAELSPEGVRARMDGYEKLERNPVLKVVPLALKNPGVSFFNWLEIRKETATLSNMGRVSAVAPLRPYIKGYHALSSTYSLFVCVCSYGDDLCIGASSVFRNTNVLKNFFRTLTDAGVAVTLYATEVER